MFDEDQENEAKHGNDQEVETDEKRLQARRELVKLLGQINYDPNYDYKKERIRGDLKRIHRWKPPDIE